MYIGPGKLKWQEGIEDHLRQLNMYNCCSADEDHGSKRPDFLYIIYVVWIAQETFMVTGSSTPPIIMILYSELADHPLKASPQLIVVWGLPDCELNRG